MDSALAGRSRCLRVCTVYLHSCCRRMSLELATSYYIRSTCCPQEQDARWSSREKYKIHNAVCADLVYLHAVIVSPSSAKNARFMLYKS